MHTHGTGCGCGNHHHEGHHHDHDHGEGCCCGNSHAHIEIEPVEDMTILQQNMMLALHERRYLPVARFAMGSADNEEVYAVAMEPVYLGSAQDTLEQAKALGDELAALARGGLITLDFDIPLNGYRYEEYETAELYRYFQDTVREGSAAPGALFDTAILEKGSMALTDEGMERVEKMLQP